MYSIRLPQKTPCYRRSATHSHKIEKTGLVRAAGEDFTFTNIVIVVFPSDHSMSNRSKLALEGREIILLEDISYSLKMRLHDFEPLYKSYVSRKSETEMNALRAFWHRLVPDLCSYFTKNQKVAVESKVTFHPLLRFHL